jgi:hypothetical protein
LDRVTPWSITKLWGAVYNTRLLSVTETIHIRYCMDECLGAVNRISSGLEETPPSYHLQCPVLAGICLILSAIWTTVPCTGRSGTLSQISILGVVGRSLSTPCPVVLRDVELEDFVAPRQVSEEASTILSDVSRASTIQPSLLLLRQQTVRPQLADSTIILCLPARILCSVNMKSSLAHQIIMREIIATREPQTDQL